MDDNIVNLTKKSLEYYDNQNQLNNEYLEGTEIKINPNYECSILKNGDIIFNGESQILGIFDYQTKIWISGWSLSEDFLDKGINTKLSRDLFDYIYNKQFSTIKFDAALNKYVHDQLCNSRILIEDNMELDLFLALNSYLLKEKIKFIYPRIRYLNTDKTKYIINYHLII
jgi:hypothetical protein